MTHISYLDHAVYKIVLSHLANFEKVYRREVKPQLVRGTSIHIVHAIIIHSGQALVLNKAKTPYTNTTIYKYGPVRHSILRFIKNIVSWCTLNPIQILTTLLYEVMLLVVTFVQYKLMIWSCWRECSIMVEAKVSFLIFWIQCLVYINILILKQSKDVTVVPRSAFQDKYLTYLTIKNKFNINLHSFQKLPKSGICSMVDSINNKIYFLTKAIYYLMIYLYSVI